MHVQGCLRSQVRSSRTFSCSSFVSSEGGGRCTRSCAVYRSHAFSSAVPGEDPRSLQKRAPYSRKWTSCTHFSCTGLDESGRRCCTITVSINVIHGPHLDVVYRWGQVRLPCQEKTVACEARRTKQRRSEGVLAAPLLNETARQRAASGNRDRWRIQGGWGRRTRPLVQSPSARDGHDSLSPALRNSDPTFCGGPSTRDPCTYWHYVARHVSIHDRISIYRIVCL